MDWFIQGGVFMYGIVAADLLAATALGVTFIVAVVTAVTKKGVIIAKILAVLTLLLSLLPLIVGAVGWWYGNMQVQAALQHASPEYIDELRAAGEHYAGIPLTFGGGSTACTFAAALLILGVTMAAGRTRYEDLVDEL